MTFSALTMRLGHRAFLRWLLMNSLGKLFLKPLPQFLVDINRSVVGELIYKLPQAGT